MIALTGCAFWALALFFPPGAILWALLLPKESPRKTLKIVLPSIWLAIIILGNVTNNPEKLDQTTSSAPVVEKAEAPVAVAIPSPVPIPPVVEELSKPAPPEKEQKAEDAASDEESSAPARPTKSEVSWKEINSIYNLQSKTTDLQKKESWKGYEGKFVIWEGRVTEISKGAILGLSLQVKMNPDTLVSDVLVWLGPEQEAKAMALKVGDRVRYSGYLDNWGQLTTYCTLKEGEILTEN